MNGIKSILACIRSADKTYNLISLGDRIAVGISGGKDSMVLFYGLHLYSKFSHTNFTLVPIIIDLGFDNFNPSEIKDFVSSLGYDLKIYEAKSVYQILKLNQKNEKHLPCSICSKMKKAIINKAAKKYKCNKVAFAHHADDAIETLLMNAIYGGKVETFAPKMFLSKDKIEFIRPICLAYEKDIIKTVKDNKIPIMKSNCPADKFTERENIKEMLNILYKKYPMAHSNFLNLLDNMDSFYLWQNDRCIRIENSNIFFKKLSTDEDFYLFNNTFLNIKNVKLKYEDEVYIIYKDNNPIGYFILNCLNKNEILLRRIFLPNKKDFLIIIKEIEMYVFRKYNPCILKTSAKLKYFATSYNYDNGSYYKDLNN